jgi:hypothetical protein
MNLHDVSVESAEGRVGATGDVKSRLRLFLWPAARPPQRVRCLTLAKSLLHLRHGRLVCMHALQPWILLLIYRCSCVVSGGEARRAASGERGQRVGVGA